MEIILNTPNLYVHLNDAGVIFQFLIDGFFEVAGQLKI